MGLIKGFLGMVSKGGNVGFIAWHIGYIYSCLEGEYASVIPTREERLCVTAVIDLLKYLQEGKTNMLAVEELVGSTIEATKEREELDVLKELAAHVIIHILTLHASTAAGAVVETVFKKQATIEKQVRAGVDDYRTGRRNEQLDIHIGMTVVSMYCDD